MDQLYLPITIVLFIAAAVKTPTAIRNPQARPAWFATLFAVPALLTRGGLVPIQTLDAWLGGENLIFLLQCWLATYAFWCLCMAAAVDATGDERPILRLWIPTAWCAIYTVPFFLIDDRGGTELFFIDAHVDDPAAVVCGILYMLGIVGICVQLIWNLRGRQAVAHWVFRLGAALVIMGSLLWIAAILIDHVAQLERSEIAWLYTSFDVFFYPGVVVLAFGLMTFAAQRYIRKLVLRRRVRALQDMLVRHGSEPLPAGDDLGFTLYDLLIRIEDLRVMRAITPSPEEERLLQRSSALVERWYPQVLDLTHPSPQRRS